MAATAAAATAGAIFASLPSRAVARSIQKTPSTRRTVGRLWSTALLTAHGTQLALFSGCQVSHALSDPTTTKGRRRFSSAAGPRAMGRSDTKTIEELVQLAKQKNEENAVVVYSKTWCPYCMDVKRLLSKLHTNMLVVELDELVEEDELQEALYKLTGQRTVPNVFIGGKHIGGCDDTVALHMKGQLVPLLAAAGAKE